MKVLMTGATSFTGYWFVRALADDGHHVRCALRRHVGEYVDQPRAERVRRLHECAEVIECAPFGDERFLECVADGPDVIAVHGAQVGEYRSPSFDVVEAVASNTRNVRTVFERMYAVGSKAVVLTGTVFEPNEGIGSDLGRAFSPYGVSKGMTWDIFRWHARAVGVSLAKFVIPNPFGPLEEDRFCTYAYKSWHAGQPVVVKYPEYVRDNIHVGLLARAYARYVAEVGSGKAVDHLGPSGYIETQGAFAQRLAREVGARLGLRCEVDVVPQTRFDEPRVRVNPDHASTYIGGWNEVGEWDRVAQWAEDTTKFASPSGFQGQGG